MKKYGLNQIRKMYLEFFESKDHLRLKSFSLIPHNDKSLLLINSGMAPMKPYFTGQEIPPRKRVTTCQKCIRTSDIENVGKTARHLTFFEMLGNFSFGDYFKEEAIAWSWEFLTKVAGLEEERLYPSVYGEDEEAFEIWTKKIGIPADKITKFYKDENGECDNFWEHGAGPCGPCSEIYYDRGLTYGCGKPDCKVGCDCDRFMEVWNNVFTQFESDGTGHYEELKQKNIDTGMGLERLSVVIQDAGSVFDIDTMKAIREKVCEIAHVTYLANEKTDISIRLITDHIRSVTFMTSDGIIPSNEGRGYVLRRLLRRAARHGRLLGIKGLFLAELCKTVIEESKDGYPELEEKKDYILKVLTREEENFNKTIDKGLLILEKMGKACQKQGEKVLSGLDAFTLYDTYGFPIDLTKEILEEKGMSIDEETFQKEMKKQKEKAQAARETMSYMGTDSTVYEEIDPKITSAFVGYEHLSWKSKITVLTTNEIVEAVSDGQKATIFVEETPFYATSGGQIADKGIIRTEEAEFKVEDTIKLLGGKIGHIGIVTKGMFKVTDVVELIVDESQRRATAKNHSATHLLQKALRIVLGSHVQQHGSYVSKDRLRFDFSHFSAMTKEELQKVEMIVNEEIAKGLAVITNIMDIEEAKKTGAMALFDEKYKDTVRVVKMGDFSTELCGGTHVGNTSNITAFKIISESGIASGVRRIEALTGEGVFAYYRQVEENLNEAARAVKTEPSHLTKRLEGLLEEIKILNSENEKLKNKLAKDSLGDAINQIIEVNGVKLLAAKASDIDMNGLRNLGDQLKEKIKEGVIILVSSQGSDKVNLIAMATEEAVKKGAHAGNLIKSLAASIGGGGGGKPNMAQAGGKNPKGMEEVLEKAPILLKEQIKEC